MKITVVQNTVFKAKDEVLIIPFFEKKKRLTGDVREMDIRSGGLIKRVLASGDFSGKRNQKKLLYVDRGIHFKRILLAGLGKEKELTLDRFRGVIDGCAKRIRDAEIESFTLAADFPKSLNTPFLSCVRAVVEGVRLGLYRFDRYKTKSEDHPKTVRQLNLLVATEKELKTAKSEVRRTQAVCDAVCLARDLVAGPGNSVTPAFLAGQARTMSRAGRLTCRVIDEKEAAKLKMGAFLSVARGSDQPAKFIILEHKPRKVKSPQTVVIVGKAITFDSGGISLKPPAKMEEMKMDMSGGAAAMVTLQACSKLDVPVHVVGLIPATENMPSGKALKPGDVVTAMSGKTIEIISTDAEGRLILADALTYAKRYQPDAVIDMATLTGACIIALGNDVSAIMGNDAALIDRIGAASERTGEKIWQLPLWEEYGELIKSDIADIKNACGRAAGTITAGYFLKEFAADYSWVHFDIAGTAWTSKNRPYTPKGASGVCVRLLTDLLENWK